MNGPWILTKAGCLTIGFRREATSGLAALVSVVTGVVVASPSGWRGRVISDEAEEAASSGVLGKEGGRLKEER